MQLRHVFQVPQPKELSAFRALADGFDLYRGSFVFLKLFDILLSKGPIAFQSFLIALAAYPNVDQVLSLHNVYSSRVQSHWLLGIE